MRTAKAFLWGVFIVLLVLFVVQNLGALSHTESLRLNLLLFSLDSPPLPVSLLAVVCLALGYMTAFGLGLVRRRRLKKEMKELNWRLGRAEEELKSLRNLPITGEMSAEAASRPSVPGGR